MLAGLPQRPAQRSGAPLGRVVLAPGPATFGLALPSGAAMESVRVGALPTQVDPLLRWADGSLRHAAVSVIADSATALAIVPSGRTSRRTWTVAWPALEIDIRTPDGRWTAQLPAQPTDDVWLDGPLVHEARAVLAPARDGTPHPCLRVLADVRTHAAGGWTLDLTFENVLDVPGADVATYDLVVRSGTETLIDRRAVRHPFLTRWRAVRHVGLQPGHARPDHRSFVQAGAIPAYATDVLAPPRRIDGAAFEPLAFGSLTRPMDAPGGRPEIAPYPDWAVQALVHGRADAWDYMTRHGELAGSWAVHVRTADGRLLRIDARPDFWLDARAGDGLANTPRGAASIRGAGEPADLAHQPSLALPPYLVTAQRFFADEMTFWANACLLQTFQDRTYNMRGGGPGRYTPRAGARGLVVEGNQVRGAAWALRNLADAAAWLPERSPDRTYFAEAVTANLQWLDDHAAARRHPLGVLFDGVRPENRDRPPYAWIALWEQAYLAWAIHRAQALGFRGGTTVRDRIIGLQVRLLTSAAEGYPPEYGAPYVLAVGTREASGSSPFTTMREVFRATYGERPAPPSSMVGEYGPEAWMLAEMGVEVGVPGAAQALAYLQRYRDREGRAIADDRRRRSGWALAPSRYAAPSR